MCTAEGYRNLVVGADVAYLRMGNEMLDLVQSEMPKLGGASDVLRLVGRMSAAMRSALLDQWEAACEFRPSLLVVHPQMLGGLHIAERLQVPAVVSLPLPFLTPTRAFPISIHRPLAVRWLSQQVELSVQSVHGSGVRRVDQLVPTQDFGVVRDESLE